ncbi:YoaK family protein [Endozoicomonas lisbonensis]|uniref:Uncharacterized membrane protein YoaK (UPF0700 family) n=1 Tax=Endozoicomonas lisbonensis TaxID=3120522 RepID=A0ABV2SH25_9GAMM
MINRLPAWVWFGGILLTFSAGVVNAIAYLSFTNQAVTHVTGSITLASVGMAQGDWLSVGRLLAVVLAFFMGAFLSGLIIKGETLRLGRGYGFILLLESCLLMISLWLYHHSSFSGQLVASLACGLQNAMVSTFSGAVLRTTHMTGILTDIGAKLGRWLRGAPMDKRRLLLYCLLLAGFTTGGAFGALLFTHLLYNSLMIPALITAFAGIAYMIHVIRLRRQQKSLYIAG